MTPSRMQECLDLLGWTRRELGQQIGMGERNVRRWLAGELRIPTPIASWLETLVAFHQDHPPPDWRVAGRPPAHAED